MLARLRIGPKLLLAPGVVLVLLVLLSCGAYYAMVRQNQSLDSIVQRRAAHMRAAAELVAEAQTAHAQAYQVLTWISGSFPRTRIDPLMRDLAVQHAAVVRGFDTLARRTADSPDERRYAEQARTAWALYLPAVRDVIEIARLDQSISANAMSKAERAFAVVAQRLTDLARREQMLSEQASDDAAGDFRLIAILMPLVIGLSIAASLAITMAVRRALLADIGAIGAAASGLAKGDLTTRPREYGQDELGQAARALDISIRSLNGTMRTVLDSARSIGSASRDITLGRAAMPARAGVRDALDRTASSMEALSTALGGSADGARAAAELADNAGAVALHGNSLVHRLVTTMEQPHRSAVRLGRIGASIEATLARAGSVAHDAAAAAAASIADPAAHGAGARDFAEAAAEVRSLSRRAARAAQDARKLARTTVEAIEGGSAWAAQAGGSMAELASAVQDVGDIVSRIGDSSSERAHDLAGVSQAIVRMDELTQQGARMVEDAALAARSLQQQALGLARTVAAFRLDEAVVHGLAGHPDETAPPGTHMLRPGRAGHPYLRLASSRVQRPR
jgi:methyl-accepting chemotaxis protein